ncbi:hypothetical protein MBLNU13_g00969t1 [Cladosporium sp. NU13]
MAEILSHVDSIGDLAAMRRCIFARPAARSQPNDDANNHNKRRDITPSEAHEPEKTVGGRSQPIPLTTEAHRWNEIFVRWTDEAFLEDAARAQEEDEENERDQESGWQTGNGDSVYLLLHLLDWINHFRFHCLHRLGDKFIDYNVYMKARLSLSEPARLRSG